MRNFVFLSSLNKLCRKIVIGGGKKKNRRASKSVSGIRRLALGQTK